MKNIFIIILLATSVLTVSFTSCSKSDSVSVTEEAKEEFSSLRFGMFIHFGLYAVTSGVWEGDTLAVGNVAEHIMRIKSIPKEQYHNLASQFNPHAFDAARIVSLAKNAGMKYIVITSKHHDGFAMFDSEYDDYNIKDGTPYGKDLLAELSRECQKQGMRLGFYYSHTRDWDEYHSVAKYGNNWDWDKDDPDRNLQVYLDSKVKPQLTELLTNYGDIFCLWFDTPGNISPEQAKDIYDHVKKLQPDCLINSRIGAGLGDYGVMGDNQIPPGVLNGVWECPATMNHSWGFHSSDTTWKSPEHMIRQLIDLSSKNVNYLLNIGPMADGSIPGESIIRLNEIGEWLKINGEAIYNTGASPWFQEMDGFRVTTGKEVVYLTIMNTEMDSVTLYNIKNDIIKVEDISGSIQIPFECKKMDRPAISVLSIKIPNELKNQTLPVIKIYINRTLKVEDQPTQMSSGNILLQVGMAKVVANRGGLYISGVDSVIDTNNWQYFATKNWNSKDDHLEWKFNVVEPGVFDVKVINVSTIRNLGSYKNRWESIYKGNEDYNRVN